jgi:DNA-binding XRE family transcriptional regulator/tetratricopeptide (TPR) repeat protein
MTASRRRGLASARKAAGYTQESLAFALDVDRTTVIRWEAGDNEPQPYLWPRLARLLRISPDQLRQLLALPAETASSAAPSVRSAAGELLGLMSPEVDRRTVLRGAAAGAALVLQDAEALRRELTGAIDHAAMSDASLDDWEHTVYQYGLANYYRSPTSLLTDLTADFAELRRLLDQRRAILVPNRLTRIVAQMAGLMSGTLLRLDQPTAARNWARTAKVVADKAGDSQLHAWVLGQEAYAHYYGGNLIQAAHVAAHAQHVANHVPCTGFTSTAALEARIHALFGRAKETHAQLDRAERALARMDAESRMPSAFGYREAQFHHHVGSAYTHLGKTTAAFNAQDQALALYPAGDYFNRPLVMLDRADCLVRDDDMPAAADWIDRALRSTGTEQRNPVIDNRARQVLSRVAHRASTLPGVQELRDVLGVGGPG